MKKFLSILLVLAMVLSLAACGKKEAADNNTAVTAAPTEEAAAPTETSATPTPTEAPAPAVEEKTSLEIFEKVWGTYTDDDMFFSEMMALDLADAATVDSFVGLPESSLSSVDEASMLMHAMNANTFTCGGFHVTSSADVDTVVASLKDNVAQRMWCCGFPDKQVIITLGDFVFSAFGEEGIIDTFVSKVTALYPAAVVAVDVPIE